MLKATAVSADLEGSRVPREAERQASQSFSLPDGYRAYYGVQQVARDGLSGGGGELPYRAELQRAFGPEHDLSGVRTHMGGAAQAACTRLGADGYAMGDTVAFRSTPSLHTAAHEVTHVIQQRQGRGEAVQFARTGTPEAPVQVEHVSECLMGFSDLDLGGLGLLVSGDKILGQVDGDHLMLKGKSGALVVGLQVFDPFTEPQSEVVHVRNGILRVSSLADLNATREQLQIRAALQRLWSSTFPTGTQDEQVEQPKQSTKSIEERFLGANMSQSTLLKRMNGYLEEQKREPIFDENGHCNGLSLLWLYHKALQREAEFWDQLSLFQKVDELKRGSETLQKSAEALMHHVEWFQHMERYIPSLSQSDFSEALALVKPPRAPEVVLEWKIAFVFTLDEITKLIGEVAQAGKMLLISSGLHATGLFVGGNDHPSEERYSFYDPNRRDGEQTFDPEHKPTYEQNLPKPQTLEDRIEYAFDDEIVGFDPYNGRSGKEKLPLSVHVFGLEGDQPGQYGERGDYLDKLMLKRQQAEAEESSGSDNDQGGGDDPGSGLCLAAEYGLLDVVMKLIALKVGLEERNAQGDTPLILASVNGHLSVVVALVEAGANVEARDEEDDENPLICAATRNHPGVVDVLLRHRANINAQKQNGATALICACELGFVKVVELLLTFKPDLTLTGAGDKTAIEVARNNNHPDIVALLDK